MPNFKVCKVYPRNGIQTISGILPKQEKIELPAKIKLNEKEVRRCMSFADVYEVVEKGDVLLTPVNYLADNSEAEVAKDVPEDELKDYTKKEEEDPSPRPDPEEPTVKKPAAPTGLQWAGSQSLPHYFAWSATNEPGITFNFYINDTKVAENLASSNYDASSAEQFKTEGTYNVSITAVKDGVESDKTTISYEVKAAVSKSEDAVEDNDNVETVEDDDDVEAVG